MRIFYFFCLFWLCFFNSCSHIDNDLSKETVELTPYEFKWYGDAEFTFGIEDASSATISVKYPDPTDEWLSVEISSATHYVVVTPTSVCLDNERSAELIVTTSSTIYKAHLTQHKLKEDDDITPFLNGELRDYLIYIENLEYGHITIDLLRDVKSLGWTVIGDAKILGLFPNLEYLNVSVEKGIVDFSANPKLEHCSLSARLEEPLRITNIDMAKNLKLIGFSGISEPEINLAANDKLEEVTLNDSEIKNIILSQSVKKLSVDNLPVENLQLTPNISKITLVQLPNLKDIDITKTKIGREDNWTSIDVYNVGNEADDFNIFIEHDQLESFNSDKWYVNFCSQEAGYAKNYRLRLYDEVEPEFEAEILSLGAEYINVGFRFKEEGNVGIKYYRGRCSESPGQGDFNIDTYLNSGERPMHYCNFKYLTPGKTYYIQLKIVTKTGTEYFSEEIPVKLKEYITPSCHIESITTKHDCAELSFIIDEPGYYDYSGYQIIVGNNPDININNADIVYSRSTNWGITAGWEGKAKLTGLKPETTYFAKVILWWDRYSVSNTPIYSEAMSFTTEREPEVPTNVVWQRCRYSTNSTTKYPSGYVFDVSLDLEASFSRYEEGDKFYFETSGVAIPKIKPTIDVEKRTMTYKNTSFKFSYYSEPYRKPWVNIRAVVEKADGRRYCSDWREMGFALR